MVEKPVVTAVFGRAFFMVGGFTNFRADALDPGGTVSA